MVPRQIEHGLEYEEFNAVLCLAEGRPPSVASQRATVEMKGLLQGNPPVRFPRDRIQDFQAG